MYFYFTDYGALHSWKCKRFIALHKDDPEEIHYLHKDGMLYVDNEIHDADSYCIENTQNSLNLTEVKYIFANVLCKLRINKINFNQIILFR